MSDPLAGCWAKLDRARSHIETLRVEIAAVSGEDLKSVPLMRKHEPEYGAVVYRVERAPEVRESWGLIIGDALHNIRGALDYVWWQLATIHLRRDPTSDEAKDVQFPIYTKPGQPLANRRFAKHIDPALIAQLEPAQPYKAPAGQVTALGALAELSNIDKHQVVHVVARPAAEGRFQMFPGTDDFHNCVQPSTGVFIETAPLPGPLQRGDEVLRAYVTPTGPNPDVNLDASLTAHITFHGNWDLLRTLDAIWMEASLYLMFFSPQIEGPSMGHA